jgi:anti-anti-sigma factor
MSFRTEKYDNYTLIKFSTDKLDAVVSPDLKSELVLINKQGEKNILIDLESVRYCDSSGLSALLIGNRLCNESKGSFILSSIQPTVAKLLVISQLDSIFKITKTFDDALGLLTIDEIERNLGVDE